MKRDVDLIGLKNKTLIISLYLFICINFKLSSDDLPHLQLYGDYGDG